MARRSRGTAGAAADDRSREAPGEAEEEPPVREHGRAGQRVGTGPPGRSGMGAVGAEGVPGTLEPDVLDGATASVDRLGPDEDAVAQPRAQASAGPPSRNEVVLVGRVSGEPLARELPSGDVLVSWRLVVDRPADTRQPPRARTATVDTLDCTAWSETERRTALGLVAGDVVEVHGALRRRFWRAGAAAASRCEVEVRAVRLLAPPQLG